MTAPEWGIFFGYVVLVILVAILFLSVLFRATRNRKAAPHSDSDRINAIERAQWFVRCVEWQQWEIDVAQNMNGPITVKGSSVRDVVDKAIATGWGR